MSVFIGRADSYEISSLKEKIKKGIDYFGGVDSILDGKKKILLKPNFLKAEKTELSSLTHPNFILAVAELLIDYGAHVTVGDSPAFGSVMGCLKAMGMRDEFQKRGIEIITFKKDRKIEGTGYVFHEMTIAAELQDYDALINLPKLKTHTQFHFTGATKNLYGCVTGKRKAWRHLKTKNDISIFAPMILHNARAVNPLLNIADGVLALHKHGPTRGKPYPLNTILISTNYLELDWIFCKMINLDPTATPLFQAAGNHEPAELSGDPLIIERNFIHARRMPISFNPLQIMKSVVRDRWIRMRSRFA